MATPSECWTAMLLDEANTEPLSQPRVVVPTTKRNKIDVEARNVVPRLLDSNEEMPFLPVEPVSLHSLHPTDSALSLLENMLTREVPLKSYACAQPLKIEDRAPHKEFFADYAFVQGLANSVYDALGPGFSESVYHKALSYDLTLHKIEHEMERVIPVMYKQMQIGTVRADIIIEKRMVVELKRAVKITVAHLQQAERYANLLDLSEIIIINFPCAAKVLVEVCVMRENGLWSIVSGMPLEMKECA